MFSCPSHMFCSPALAEVSDPYVITIIMIYSSLSDSPIFVFLSIPGLLLTKMLVMVISRFLNHVTC